MDQKRDWGCIATIHFFGDYLPHLPFFFFLKKALTPLHLSLQIHPLNKNKGKKSNLWKQGHNNTVMLQTWCTKPSVPSPGRIDTFIIFLQVGSGTCFSELPITFQARKLFLMGAQHSRIALQCSLILKAKFYSL